MDWLKTVKTLSDEELKNLVISREEFTGLLTCLENTPHKYFIWFTNPSSRKLQVKALQELFNFIPSIKAFGLERKGFRQVNDYDFTHNGYPTTFKYMAYFLESPEAKSFSVEYEVPLSEMWLLLRTIILLEEEVLGLNLYPHEKVFPNNSN